MSRRPVRKPTRKRAPARRKTARPSPRLSRRRILGLVALILLLALPVTRRAMASVWGAVERSIAATRAADARERELGGYVRRYGITREMADAIERAARAEGIETELAFRLVRVESAFKERAVSHVGAVGLTQLMPATAAELHPGITRERLFERDTNLRLGFRYFKQLLALYDGDTEEALHAYNRGMGTVARIRRRGGDPANGYADAVLGNVGASPVRKLPPDSGPASPDAPPVHEIGPTRLPEAM